MTATAVELSLRPRVHAAVRLGPGLTDGAAVTHHLKDPRTGWFFRVGAREFFVISRLDGERSLADIGEEYRAHFGRTLTEAHFISILSLLGTRQLLEGAESEEALERLSRSARAKSRGRRNILHWRIPLAKPGAMLAKVEPRLRWLYSPLFVLPALAAMIGMLVLIGTQAQTLYAQGREVTGQVPLLIVFIVLFWLSLAAHETAHGLTCVHYGGSAPEIGLLWRFPLLAPYCKADDVMLFAQRRHRVYTAFAGVFAHLLVLTPFAVLWLVLAPGPVRSLAAAMVLFGSASALVNLVPFVQLDGYFMLNHSLNMLNLRTGSYQFWGRVARRLIGRGATLKGYPVWAGWVYAGYGLISFVLATSITTYFFTVWYGQLRGPLGDRLAATTMALSLLVFALIGFYWWRRSRRGATS